MGVNVKGKQAACRQRQYLRCANWQLAEVELRQQHQRSLDSIAQVIAVLRPVADTADARGFQRQVTCRVQAVGQPREASSGRLRAGCRR